MTSPSKRRGNAARAPFARLVRSGREGCVLSFSVAAEDLGLKIGSCVAVRVDVERRKLYIRQLADGYETGLKLRYNGSGMICVSAKKFSEHLDYGIRYPVSRGLEIDVFRVDLDP